jgi:hypothetical protein
MPIHHAVWTVDETPKELPAARLVSEQRLEDMIVSNSDVLSNDWMLIGRQEPTTFSGRIDLLAIAYDGSLVLIELKRDKTPRDIVTQALDYASWVETLTAERIAQIYSRFTNGGSLSEAFRKRFNEDLDEEALNDSHQIVIVASELDPATERIIQYLNARDIAVNAVFFQVFEHLGQQLLSRAWLIDPRLTQSHMVTASTAGKGEKEPWNGEFYVSFGGLDNRAWEDARKHGFISAGGASWYSQTLKLLSPGDRVWVKIPKTGYVGVGRVLEAAAPAKDFYFETPEGRKSALDGLKYSDQYKETAEDQDRSEYFVRIEWLDTVAEANAVNAVGFFGNQNTVCQPVTPKWRHTVDSLKAKFKH